MKIVNPGFEIIDGFDAEVLLRKIELAGRICYKSENHMTEDSAEGFIERLIRRGHESVIEHGAITVKIVCDRGVTHELVRHRVASYSQESTRYCNYANDKFGNEITVIRPCFWEEGSEAYALWEKSMAEAEKSYLALLESGASAQQARAVLPNSLKTEIIVTMNLREWRHFLKLRCTEAAHPQMKEIAAMILKSFRTYLPVIFNDLECV